MQCLCWAEFCSFQHNRNLRGAGTDLTEVVPNGNEIKLDFNWKCRKGLLLRSLCNQWRHSLNTMGGSPCFPCSPVSEPRCGCWGDPAQGRPRFLSPCSFLHRTMPGTSASQARAAGHAENPFPPAKMGRTSQPRAAVLLQQSPAAGRLAQSWAGCAPALPRGLGEKQTRGGLFTYFTAKKHWSERKPVRMCSLLGSLLLFTPCKGSVLVQNAAG